MGPPGVEEVVSGFEEAYRLDDGYRIAHHGDALAPEAARLAPHVTVVSDIETETVVLDDGDLKVTAFLVDHAPIAPAYGYRVDYKDRSVVISGDTVKHSNIARIGKDTDVLIHEALNKDMVLNIAGVAEGRRTSQTRPRILRDVLDYHASPVEAAESANEAGAGLLVFTHIVPPLPNRIIERVFLRGVDDIRPEGVMLGYDGLHIALPAGSAVIDVVDP